jgi:hypothetical protein
MSLIDRAPELMFAVRFTKRMRLSVMAITALRAFPDDVRFYWSLHGVVLTRAPGIHTDGAAPTLEEAKAQFRKSWEAWKAWANLEERDQQEPAQGRELP